MSEEWKYTPARDLGLSGRERRRSPSREPGLVGLASNFVWRALTRAYMAAAHRLSMEGRENLPEHPPYVMVANPPSHLDAVILGIAAPKRCAGLVFPIAAADTFFEKPLPATFATAFMNCLPLRRKHCGGHTLDEFRRRLVEDRCVFILFPEGTRSRSGKMGRFKPGIGRLVCGAPVPVVPCHIQGAWTAMPPDAILPRPRKIRLRIGEPLDFGQTPDDRRGWDSAAAEIEEAVRSLGDGADDAA